MNFKKYHYLLIVSLFVSLSGAVYFYMCFQQLKNTQTSTAMTTISIAGRLLEMKKFIDTGDASSKQKIATD
jgi:hypothetical protein